MSASSSHLQLCGSKPCPRVIVQDRDAIFAVGWPVLRAGLDYVVHGLFWVAAVACGRVFQTPAFHSSGAKRPTPVRRRLSVVHCLRGRSSPSSSPGSSTNLCSLEWSAACHSSVHLRVSHVLLETSAGVDRRS